VLLQGLDYKLRKLSTAVIQPMKKKNLVDLFLVFKVTKCYEAHYGEMSDVGKIEIRYFGVCASPAVQN
jgi:hypothetical protein